MKKIWSKRHSIRLAESWAYGPLQFKKIWGVPFPNQFTGFVDGFGSGYVDEKMYRLCLDHLLKQIYAKGFHGYFEKKGAPAYQSFLAYAKKLAKVDFSSLSSKELSATWKAFIKKEDGWMNYMWIIFLLDEGLTEELQRVLGAQATLDREHFMPAMVAPTKKTAAANMQLALLKIAALPKKGGGVSKKIDALVKKYSYFSVLQMDETPLDRAYFVAAIQELRRNNPKEKLRQLLETERRIRLDYSKLRRDLRRQPKLLRLIDACKHVAYYREYRNDIRQESYLHVRPLYQEIARRMAVELGEVIFATRQQIEQFFETGKKTTGQQLARQKKCSAITADYRKGTVKYMFDTQAVRTQWPKELAASLTCRGVSAYAGKVRGVVRVIFDVPTQGRAFKKGEILVATTTNLNFVPLMTQAAAIVTDQGGLLTHTAVIAREFKIPCVVGTKNVTAVFKNGDRVEVDATKGIVRKI
jgi:phosphohistidine swiveling domain-containing protein